MDHLDLEDSQAQEELQEQQVCEVRLAFLEVLDREVNQAKLANKVPEVRQDHQDLQDLLEELGHLDREENKVLEESLDLMESPVPLDHQDSGVNQDLLDSQDLQDQQDLPDKEENVDNLDRGENLAILVRMACQAPKGVEESQVHQD